MSGVNHVDVSASLGTTDDSAGNNNTSSKVNPVRANRAATGSGAESSGSWAMPKVSAAFRSAPNSPITTLLGVLSTTIPVGSDDEFGEHPTGPRVDLPFVVRPVGTQRFVVDPRVHPGGQIDDRGAFGAFGDHFVDEGVEPIHPSGITAVDEPFTAARRSPPPG